MADYTPRPRDDDEISLISMRELAPSPIEEDEFYASDDTASGSPPSLQKSGTLPTAIPPAATSTVGLWLTRTQKYTSYLFLSFLGVHASTAALSPLLSNLDSSNPSLLLARTYYYQSTPTIEALLIPGSLALHITSGLGLRLYRHLRQRHRYGGSVPASVSMWRWRNFSTLSRTGYLAIPFVALHAGLNRLIPLWVDGDSSQIGLEFVAFGFYEGEWGKWIGGAFYAGLIGLVSYHTVFGWSYWMKVSERRRKLVGAAAVGVAAVWAGGLAKVVVEGKVGGYLGRHYEKLYRVFWRAI
ncbi:hypothetical protein FPQ18DRAFT_405788 [Pyronema domesticum]|uniref:Mitochondrial adapter protein MCP1 transmembrane domain-containing protein n=1 Tax=Pyronema omphalodes (strain CBS 100304) TaxID=1076935 RepID=U4LNP5_PYROM|nr:hypothetical protein FPQ18DRAFT_405788 [Pyronema domesticum]CCX33207.1 Similar to hypothetical protein [Tuber melanosporum Mel28]; acc. no. XP_002835938 [Pyronema omphalodes CBS 100304]